MNLKPIILFLLLFEIINTPWRHCGRYVLSRPPPGSNSTLPTLHLCSLSSLLSFWSHLPPPPPQQVHYSPGSGVNLGWTPSLDFIGASRYLVLLLPFELVSLYMYHITTPPTPPFISSLFRLQSEPDGVGAVVFALFCLYTNFVFNVRFVCKLVCL